MTQTNKDENESAPEMWPVQHIAGRLVAGIYDGARSAAAAFATWCRQEALERELHRLKDEDLADIGISRDQIAAAARAQDAPQLLRRMLERLDITDRALARHPGLRAELARVCMTCEARGECRRWFGRGQSEDSYRDFCPNESELTALRKAG